MERNHGTVNARIAHARLGYIARRMCTNKLKTFHIMLAHKYKEKVAPLKREAAVREIRATSWAHPTRRQSTRESVPTAYAN